MNSNEIVSLEVEIPDALNDSLNAFVEAHSAWDFNRVFTAGLSLFLLQNGENDRTASRVYLDTLFNFTGD